MTQRNRTIYNQEELYVSNITGAAGAVGTIVPGEATVLHRIQSTSYDTNVTRVDVQEQGKLARLGSMITEPPSVSLNFEYFLADGYNETGIGLSAATANPPNALSGILSNLASAEKNFYVMTTQPGLDAHGVSPQSADNSFVAFGNCFLSSYNLNVAVGEIPSASTSWECSNVTIVDGAADGFQNPAIIATGQGTPTQYTGKVTLPLGSTGSLSVVALRPGDIVLDFGTDDLQIGGPVLPGTTSAETSTAMHVQSVSIEIPLSRTPQNKIGSAFAFSKELDVPISVTMNVSANIADIVNGNLLDLICEEEQPRDITLTIYDPCTSTINMKFDLKGAIFDSSSYSNAVGDNAKTVELTFSAQMGGANDSSRGLFITKKV